MQLAYQFQEQRSKVKVARPINANTHTSCSISAERQGLRTSNLVYGLRTTTRTATGAVTSWEQDMVRSLDESESGIVLMHCSARMVI